MHKWLLSFGLILLIALPGAGCSIIEPKPEWEIEGWELVWHDEFNDATGTAPDPANWTLEIGDGSDRGIPGWGNHEREYYTDFLIANVAVGGYWPGNPDETTRFPQTMQVDYVRVYQAPDTAKSFEWTIIGGITK